MRKRLLPMLLIAGWASGAAAETTPSPAATALTAEQKLALRRTPVVDVFERRRDAVVNISSTEIVTVRRPAGMFNDIFEDMFDMPQRPRTQEYRRTSIGSGFVLHPDGYIVTNAHVVARTTDRKAIFADGSEYDAQLLAIDANRDLAVLKIDADRSLPALTLGRSDDLMVGETVIAIGNPLGYQHTVTAGVVSAVDRDLEFNAEQIFRGLIQTDASVNPGNSGGPLLNALGELIGINTAIRSDAQNIGFAIPVDQLRELLPDLLDIERRYDIVVGMTVDNLDEPRVIAVDDGSPAQQAGIEPGDILSRIDDDVITQGVDYYIDLIGRKAGSTLRVCYLRRNTPFETAIHIAARPAPDGDALAKRKLGLRLESLPDDIARQLELPGDAGLLVSGVENGGPASQIGVEPRDVLVSIGRHYVASLDDLGDMLDDVDPGETVTFAIVRVTNRGKLLLTGRLRAR